MMPLEEVEGWVRDVLPMLKECPGVPADARDWVRGEALADIVNLVMNGRLHGWAGVALSNAVFATMSNEARVRFTRIGLVYMRQRSLGAFPRYPINKD
jgi:hypothetical protein